MQPRQDTTQPHRVRVAVADAPPRDLVAVAVPPQARCLPDVRAGRVRTRVRHGITSGAPRAGH